MKSTSSFMLVINSILDSPDSNGMDDSMVIDRVEDNPQPQRQRGWDWRAGLPSDAKGEDVLRILRLSVAKEIARNWIRGNVR